MWLGLAEIADFERTRAVNLERALGTRAVIDQAKGIIMVQQNCTADAAFEQLRRASMDHNMKLADLADELVAGASSHPATQRPDSRAVAAPTRPGAANGPSARRN